MPRIKKVTSPETTVVPAQASDEQKYEACLSAIAGRKRRLAELEAELRTLREALVRFEAVCHARVGDLLEQLRDVAEAIARLERRLDPALPDDLDPSFIDDEFERPADGSTDDYRQHQPAEREKRSRRRLVASDEADAKRMYKDLARRFHPDLALSDEDRREREAMMQSVNEAYRARDLAELRSLYVRAEAADPSFGDRPIADRLAWARAELSRLNGMVDQVGEELAALRGMEVHRLWRSYSAGDPVLDQLEDQLEEKLAAQGRRLDLTIAACRRMEAELRRDTTILAG
jgi:hypothetical protein